MYQDLSLAKALSRGRSEIGVACMRDNFIAGRLQTPGAPAGIKTNSVLDGDVDISLVSHALGHGQEQFFSCLTQDDFAEFSDDRHPGVRHRKLRTRAWLRHQLSKAVEHEFEPGKWLFKRTSNGKPYLGAKCPNLYFNCSHTDTASIVATSTKGPVGVDIEDSRAHFDLSFTTRFASPRERFAVSELSASSRQDALVRLWTLKEAYVKFFGTGIAQDLRKIEFDLTLFDGQATLLGDHWQRPVHAFCQRINSKHCFLTAALVTDMH